MELMVGLTIGMLVVVAALGTMGFIYQSSQINTDAAQLQQKADAVFRIIGRQVAQAGALSLVSPGDPGKVVFSNAFTGFNPATTGAGNQIFAVHGVSGKTGTLRISYEPDALDRDCLGVSRDNSDTLVRMDNEFMLKDSNLTCKGANTATGAQPIADGVEDFQLYFPSRTGTGATTQFQQLQASQVTNWTAIKGVTVCLVLRGDRINTVQAGLSETDCSGKPTKNDGYVRHVYWRNFALRNQ
jgi:type IV pilus assembly protein PilW